MRQELHGPYTNGGSDEHKLASIRLALLHPEVSDAVANVHHTHIVENIVHKNGRLFIAEILLAEQIIRRHFE